MLKKRLIRSYVTSGIVDFLNKRTGLLSIEYRYGFIPITFIKTVIIDREFTGEHLDAQINNLLK